MINFTTSRKKREFVYKPEFCYEVVFKKGALESIMMAKGWKSDLEVSNALGFTKAYIGRLRKQQQAVSHTVIIRMALAIGNIHEKWWIFYEIRPSANENPDAYQKYNMEKYRKEIPYNRFSPSAEFRRFDGKVQQLELF